MDNFLIWLYIRDSIQFLPQKYGRINRGRTARKYQCFDDTSNVMSFPLGRMFIERKIDSQTRPQVKISIIL